MCDKVVSKEPIMLKHCPDRQNTTKMCGKPINSFITHFFGPLSIGTISVCLTCLSALKFAINLL